MLKKIVFHYELLSISKNTLIFLGFIIFFGKIFLFIFLDSPKKESFLQ
jgi:hypothetical protein